MPWRGKKDPYRIGGDEGALRRYSWIKVRQRRPGNKLYCATNNKASRQQIHKLVFDAAIHSAGLGARLWEDKKCLGLTV